MTRFSLSICCLLQNTGAPAHILGKLLLGEVVVFLVLEELKVELLGVKIVMVMLFLIHIVQVQNRLYHKVVILKHVGQTITCYLH